MSKPLHTARGRKKESARHFMTDRIRIGIFLRILSVKCLAANVMPYESLFLQFGPKRHIKSNVARLMMHRMFLNQKMNVSWMRYYTKAQFGLDLTKHRLLSKYPLINIRS